MSRLRQWKCKDGTSVAIKDMETSHIKNTIRLLMRKAEEWSQPVFLPFDDDYWEVDGYQTLVNGTPVYLWLDNLNNELVKRKEQPIKLN